MQETVILYAWLLFSQCARCLQIQFLNQAGSLYPQDSRAELQHMIDPVTHCNMKPLPAGLELGVPGLCWEKESYYSPCLSPFGEVPDQQLHTAQREHNFQKATCQVIQSLHNLLRDGLRYDRFGLDFSKVDEVRYSVKKNVSNGNLLSDDDIRRIFSLYYDHPWDEWEQSSQKYFTPTNYRAIDTRGWQWRKFAFDYASFAYRPGFYSNWVDERARDMARGLREEGVALIENLGFDLPALRKDHSNAMREYFDGTDVTGDESKLDLRKKMVPPTGGHIFSGSKLKSLVGVQHTKQWIFDAISRYLGEDAIYNGHAAHRLFKGFNEASYRPASWHHDECGTRLKLWIFLHDTDSNGHPTEIAVGSHKTRKFVEDTLPKKEYVQQAYKIKSLQARAGGGYIFNTNAYHRAKVEGEQVERNAVVLEFNSKAGNGKRHHLNCPDNYYLSEENVEIPFSEFD